jgi:hypothetical protein
MNSHDGGNELRCCNYEFSCSNSSDPGSSSSFASCHHAYFPCLGAIAEEDKFPVVTSLVPLARIEYSPIVARAYDVGAHTGGGVLRVIAAPGDFSVRVSIYLSGGNVVATHSCSIYR